MLGTLSYLGVMCFIPLMINDKDEFVLFHARQGLILWGWSVLAGFIMLVPGIGTQLANISWVMVMVFSALGILSVIFQKAWKMPFVHKLSQAF